MKLFLITSTFALSGIVAGMIASSHDDVVVIRVEPPTMAGASSFDDNWRDATMAVAYRTALVELALPTGSAQQAQAQSPVKIDSIKPEPAPTNAPSAAETDKERSATSMHRRHVDRRKICARNRWRKIYVSNGRSWRCRK